MDVSVLESRVADGQYIRQINNEKLEVYKIFMQSGYLPMLSEWPNIVWLIGQANTLINS